MIRNLLLLVVFVAGSLFSQKAAAQGYELKVRIKNLANKEIILGHHFADKLYPDDTLKLDNTGQGTLKGNTRFPEGNYFFLTPSHKLVDFFLTENQHFSLETDSLDLYEKLKFENSPENSAALEYSRFIAAKQKETNDLLEKNKTITDADLLKKNKEQIERIGKEVKAKADKVIDAQKDNFVGVFLKAAQEITIPDPPKDSEGKILDSTFQYKYYRSHYFDNINLSDARFLRTPIYDQRIKTFIEKVIPQIPDTLNKECDKLLEIAEKDKDIFRYMLVTLFNYAASSSIMGFDAVYVHIAEKWYVPKSTFGDTAFIRKTKENIAKLKPLLIGKPAPDLRMLWVPADHFIQAKTDSIAMKNPHLGSFTTIYQINAKYTILAFWESDCSHCKKQIPELYEVYQRLKPKGVEVMAIHMLGGVEGKQKWIKFVNEHEMYDWLNVWNPYDFTYKKTYDIMSTPVLFVLDKDKKIIAKRLEPKQIEDYINALIKQDEKKK